MIIPRITFLEGGFEAAQKAGFNARHDLTKIRIHQNIENMPATLAQEIREWRFLRVVSIRSAAPLMVLSAGALYLGSPAWAIAFLMLAITAFLVVPKLDVVRRKMELHGHAVEVEGVRLLGEDYKAWRRKEARQMIPNPMSPRYQFFNGWNVDKMHKELVSHEASAKRWMNKYWSEIKAKSLS